MYCQYFLHSRVLSWMSIYVIRRHDLVYVLVWLRWSLGTSTIRSETHENIENFNETPTPL